MVGLIAVRLPAVEVTAEEIKQAQRFADSQVSALTADPVSACRVLRSTQGWGLLHLGYSVNHLPLRLKGRQFASGFGSHADAKIKISIPAGARRLTGVCGIDDTEEARQYLHPVGFAIEADGKPVWQCKPRTSVDDPANFDIDLRGVRSIALEATAAGENSYTPVDFVDLKVELDNGQIIKPGQAESWLDHAGGGAGFSYGDAASSSLLKNWKLEQSDLPATPTYTARRIARTDPVTGLTYAITIRRYKRFPIVEWTTTFENTGTANTPILSDIHSLDLNLRPSDPIIVHYASGDHAAEDSYEPHVAELKPGGHLRFAPQGGRPTDTAWPYFNLENPAEHNGAIIAVGWPGQWSADFDWSGQNTSELHLSAGQELTHFVLHQGERARTPVSVMMFYQGDSARAQNLWRRWMLDENVPRVDGRLPLPVNASSLGLHQSEKTELAGIELFAAHNAGLSHWWMDAGWYPCENWWDGVGSWRPDPGRFPNGIKPVSDSAHAHGMKLILWLEPERVHPGTDLDHQHPEWLLGKDGHDKLLNLGNQAALSWLTETIDGLIRTQGIDVYRQDFNEPALDFWRANDAPDRQGMTEMRHVEGYLKLWDELRARHPSLLIDTCASGGRRLDLETLRRSVPLWRCDDSENPEHNQCQTYGLASWLPLFGSGTGCNSSYTIRSQMLPFFTLGMGPDGKEPDWDLYHREKANWDRIHDDMLGDYYPLLPYSREPQSWIAWQFNRADLGTGVVQAFRRPDSPFEVAKFPLHGLDPAATYSITNVDQPNQSELVTGRRLMDDGIKVTMSQQPAASILIYTQK
jgi:alpha-galactosidase